MAANGYRKGDYYAYCDVCGQRYFASRLRLRWDNLMVCPKDWEIRPPQEFVRGIPDPVPPSWVRPDPGSAPDIPSCTLTGISGVVGYGVVGCMIVGGTAGVQPAQYCPYGSTVTAVPDQAVPDCAVPG